MDQVKQALQTAGTKGLTPWALSESIFGYANQAWYSSVAKDLDNDPQVIKDGITYYLSSYRWSKRRIAS
jgi:hypothetical protein